VRTTYDCIFWFQFSECKQESECNFEINAGAGAGVTSFGTRAEVKKRGKYCGKYWGGCKLLRFFDPGQISN